MGAPFDVRAPSGPRYVPSPTAEQFILATSEGPRAELRLLILEGPRGEGKTSAGIMACMALGQRIASEPLRRGRLPVKVAIVRDTWVNIERTTLESIRDQARNGMAIVEHEGGRELSLMTPDGLELVRISCFGLDRREDADKLQGFQCAILWLEEVAPAAGVSGRPASSETHARRDGRGARQQGRGAHSERGARLPLPHVVRPPV